MLAPYACDPSNSKGRLLPEPHAAYRNPFARDRDRIIHSNAFKRLQYKTQVFINHQGDHYRNRLTHSLEVSTVARSLAKTLSLSDDLVECIALAHDLGHPPFGHAGEQALNQCMKNYGGFAHNPHALKILTKLEHKYAAHSGLNLTWEVLEGVVKHNGPLLVNVPTVIAEYNRAFDLKITTYPSAEAQVASLADDIAYVGHDLEDSINAGIITFSDFQELAFINNYIIALKEQFSDIKAASLIFEVVRKLTHHFVDDLLHQTTSNLKRQQITTAEDIRQLNYQLVDFSAQLKQEIAAIKQFLLKKVYKHPKVKAATFKCQKIIKELFSLYLTNKELLPYEWQALIDTRDVKLKAGIIADYIAGMTDRFIIKEYNSFYSLNTDNF